MIIIDYSVIIYFLLIFFIVNLILLVAALDHFVIALIYLDLLLLANILLFALYTALTHYPLGYNYALLTIGIAAADTSVGLGLCIMYYKATGEVSVN